MLVWLGSYPRSGNTFFRIVAHALYGIKTYSIYNDRVLEERPEIAEIVGHVHLDRSIQDVVRGDDVSLVKTHELAPADGHPGIYIVRDGRDALVSYAHYVLSFEGGDQSVDSDEAFTSTLHDLILQSSGFGGWSANVSSWLGRPRTAVIRFDDLIVEPVAVVRKALGSAGLSLEGSSEACMIPNFQELHRAMPEFFGKGQVGRWTSEMPDDLHELFWECHAESMRALGYGTVSSLEDGRETPGHSLRSGTVAHRYRTTLECAEERLESIKRLEAIVTDLQSQLEAKERVIQELASAARERLAIIDQLKSR
jgi:hypothetical protein